MTSFERAILSPAATTPSLSVSASPDQLPVLRSLIRTVAAHYALSLSRLSDLVLAADILYERRNVALLLDRRVVSVDAAAHNVTLADGSTIGYGALVWATGGSPRAARASLSVWV